MLLAALLAALAGDHLGTRRPSARVARVARCARCAEVSTAIQYGGIPHVAVIVGDAKEALTYYTEVLGMTDASSEAMDKDVPGACVRVGEQTIQLMQLSTPDPFDVDPTYSMSAPPPGTASAPRTDGRWSDHPPLTVHRPPPSTYYLLLTAHSTTGRLRV